MRFLFYFKVCFDCFSCRTRGEFLWQLGSGLKKGKINLRFQKSIKNIVLKSGYNWLTQEAILNFRLGTEGLKIAGISRQAFSYSCRQRRFCCLAHVRHGTLDGRPAIWHSGMLIGIAAC